LRFPFFGKKINYAEAAPTQPGSAMLSEVSASQSILYPPSSYAPYNPDKLYQRRGSYDLVDKMRDDDQIKPILEFKKSIVIGSGFYVDSANEEVKEFWDYALNEYFEGQFQHSLFEILSGIEYGFSISEILYGSAVIKEIGNKPYWLVRNIRPAVVIAPIKLPA
jgi:hypothetical protein